MTIVAFFIILAVLVLTHELGHFLVAKKSGIKVEEFGLGFPPRLWGIKKGETFYSINLIPFGGFVKILGENAGEEIVNQEDTGRSLTTKSRPVQALVLAGGVAFNILLAWVILSFGLSVGLPTSRAGVPAGYKLDQSQLVIVDVLKDSPAAKAGLVGGDIVNYLTDGVNKVTNPTVEEAQQFISARENSPLTVGFTTSPSNNSKAEVKKTTVVPKSGLAAGRPGIGISLDEVGFLKLPVGAAIIEGFRLTALVIWSILLALGQMLAGLFNGQTAIFSSVTGPVGLVGIVGSSLALGLSYLLNLTAVISLNLAVINLLPFPALDGGRILFLVIEGIRQKAISPKILNAANSAGFAILLILMALLTYRDILHLFGY